MSEAKQRRDLWWLGDSVWIRRWGQCGVCAYYSPLGTPKYGSCMRFELWPVAGAGGRVLSERHGGRLMGEEVFVQEEHGCPSFRATAEALEGAFLEAFGEVEAALDAYGVWARDGHLVLPSLIGVREWVVIAERRRAAVIVSWHGLSSLSKRNGRLVALLEAVKVRVAELLSKRNQAEYWLGQDWVDELYGLVHAVLVNNSADESFG